LPTVAARWPRRWSRLGFSPSSEGVVDSSLI
jgi:hypothetical protein